MLWEFWFNRFQWGMVAKHSLNPKNFYYASTLTAGQVTALPEEVDGKDRLASEQTLISNLYLCNYLELVFTKPIIKLGSSFRFDDIDTENSTCFPIQVVVFVFF